MGLTLHKVSFSGCWQPGIKTTKKPPDLKSSGGFSATRLGTTFRRPFSGAAIYRSSRKFRKSLTTQHFLHVSIGMGRAFGPGQ